MICPKCNSGFEQVRAWQKFCSERCRLNVQRQRKRRRAREGRAVPIMSDTTNCAHCGGSFLIRKAGQRYCSNLCRSRGRSAMLALGRPPRTKRLRCKWCRGEHMTPDCPNPRGVSRRQFGTVVEGQYVPPPGVAVRRITIPNTVHGDTVGALLKEVDR